MPIFCDQSQIWEKYIKEMGWQNLREKRKAFFCELFYIYERYIKATIVLTYYDKNVKICI